MLFGHARTTYHAVNVYVNIYDVAFVTLCCPLGLMNVNKQTGYSRPVKSYFC